MCVVIALLMLPAASSVTVVGSKSEARSEIATRIVYRQPSGPSPPAFTQRIPTAVVALPHPGNET
jgi:hypothetical protein